MLVLLGIILIALGLYFLCIAFLTPPYIPIKNITEEMLETHVLHICNIKLLNGKKIKRCIVKETFLFQRDILGRDSWFSHYEFQKSGESITIYKLQDIKSIQFIH